MLKLLLLTCVASTLALEGKGNGKIYSMHTRFQSGSLNLSTGELKVFSGHAMNMIGAKCPAVDKTKIQKIQKYIGKLIAKNEPVQGKSKDFKGLLDTLTSCAKEGVVPKSEDEMDQPSSFFPFYPPFHRIRKVFIQRIPVLEGTDKKKVDDTTTTSAPTAAAGVDPGLTKPAVVAPVPETKKEKVVVAEPEPRRVVTTTIYVRPQDMKEGIRTSGGFFNWVRNILSKVRGFFSTMIPLRGNMRKRRDTSDISSPPSAGEMTTALAPYQVWTPTKDDSKGKKAFGTLVDQMCRIYCDTCSKRDIYKFKMAAKQLLTQLFEEDSGLEVAAKQYLDDDFLASIEKCE